jgi:hypothetical protein
MWDKSAPMCPCPTCAATRQAWSHVVGWSVMVMERLTQTHRPMGDRRYWWKPDKGEMNEG